MKMTNREMQEYIDVLAGAKETGKLGYAIARNVRRMKDAAKEYTDARDALLPKYGTPGRVPGKYTVTMDALEKINAELADIADIESDVDIYQVPEDVFIAGNLTSDQMTVLLWMVVEPKREEEKHE